VRKLLVTLALGVGLLVATSSSVGAYGGGPANWQVGFAGTGVVPTTGIGFGFWGWCEFSGGVVAGTNSDCQVSQYVHSPTFSVNCEQSINVISWTAATGTFVINETSTTNPSSATAMCLAAGGVPPADPAFDTHIPAFPNHYNLNGLFGAPGELQLQVTEITGPF
jgi:hypothetical protein